MWVYWHRVVVVTPPPHPNAKSNKLGNMRTSPQIRDETRRDKTRDVEAPLRFTCVEREYS